MCRRTPIRALRAVLLTAAIALFLGGCGASIVHERGHLVELTLREYRIAPQSVSVPAGKLVIVARNKGILTHNIAVEAGRLDDGSPDVIAASEAIPPGASAALEVDLPRPGSYLLVSTIANQRDLGMNGTMLVR